MNYFSHVSRFVFGVRVKIIPSSQKNEHVNVNELKWEL